MYSILPRRADSNTSLAPWRSVLVRSTDVVQGLVKSASDDPNLDFHCSVETAVDAIIAAHHDALVAARLAPRRRAEMRLHHMIASDESVQSKRTPGAFHFGQDF